MARLVLRQVARAYLISIGIWCALSLLTAWQYLVLDRTLNLHWPLLGMMKVAEARGFAFALLTPPIFYVVRRYLATGMGLGRKLYRHLLGAPLFIVCFVCIRWTLLRPYDWPLHKYLPRSLDSLISLLRDGWADQIAIYIAIVVAAYAREYFKKVRQQELERSEYQRALAASELQALKMQLRPHFLFNTLHGIAALIDDDQQNAKAMVVKLSTLLRTALERRGPDLIPLRDELSFTGEYLELEKMRFGPRMTVVWSVEPDTRELLVPQLILQPLVENAIRHGISSSRGEGWIEIGSRRYDGVIELRIRNSLGGRSSGGLGVGLRNTETRLRHLYSGDASLSFVLAGDNTAAATLVLPALGQQPADEGGSEQVARA